MCMFLCVIKGLIIGISCQQYWIFLWTNPILNVQTGKSLSYMTLHTLLKNIRNNFKKHGFVHGDDSIQWEHVVNFYNFDRRGGIKMAPKLTEQHIYLPMFTKMRVRLAAQVLSHSVAAGITTLARLNHLPMEALSTATFLENMDQLFNAFNSSTFLSKQKFGHASISVKT